MPRSRFAFIGSAVAAAVAIGVLSFSHFGASKVHAATILKSLRQRQVHTVRMTFTGLRAENFSIDGSARIQFAQPIALDQAFADDFQPDIAAVHSEASLVQDDNAVHFEGVYSPASTWLYIKGEIPQAAMFAPGFRNGVMLDLGADPAGALGMFGNIHIGGGEVGVNGGMQLVGPDEIPPELLDPNGPAHVDIQVNGDPKNPGGIASIPENLLKSLFSGSATGDQLREIEQQLNQSASSATVQDLGSGRYLLVCTPTGDREDGVGTTRIAYAQNEGVEWIEVQLVGEMTGLVRIDFDMTPIDLPLLDKSRLLAPESRTTIITPETLRGFLPSR